jgi:hypothetical protein
MLTDPDIDAVSITTMWDQHTDITINALKSIKENREEAASCCVIKSIK